VPCRLKPTAIIEHWAKARCPSAHLLWALAPFSLLPSVLTDGALHFLVVIPSVARNLTLLGFLHCAPSFLVRFGRNDGRGGTRNEKAWNFLKQKVHAYAFIYFEKSLFYISNIMLMVKNHSQLLWLFCFVLVLFRGL
jgi:hypothetical protein